MSSGMKKIQYVEIHSRDSQKYSRWATKTRQFAAESEWEKLIDKEHDIISTDLFETETDKKKQELYKLNRKGLAHLKLAAQNEISIKQ